MNTKKGINYYPFDDAIIIRDVLVLMYPHCKIVEYDLGWAVQYYASGCYYPEIPDPNSRYNPANW